MDEPSEEKLAIFGGRTPCKPMVTNQVDLTVDVSNQFISHKSVTTYKGEEGKGLSNRHVAIPIPSSYGGDRSILSFAGTKQ